MAKHRNSDEQETFELLSALESDAPGEWSDRRNAERLRWRGQVRVSGTYDNQPDRSPVPADLLDLSRDGCRLVAPVPLQVGDVFRITFDREELDIPLSFARCTRCRLLREDSFEAGLEFFSPIQLPENKPDFDF